MNRRDLFKSIGIAAIALAIPKPLMIYSRGGLLPRDTIWMLGRGSTMTLDNLGIASKRVVSSMELMNATMVMVSGS